MKLIQSCLCAMLVWPLAAASADVFRWTDESGKVHYGEQVPEKYRQRARIVELSGAELSEAQRQAAQASLARDRAYLEQPPPRGPAPEAASAPPAVPAQPPGRSSCEERWREFDEAWACFNPYRLANGGVKAEGFRHCKVVAQPEPCY